MITVYTAAKIRTMDPGTPEATSVAVRDGIILDVGTIEQLQPWLDSDDYVINTDYQDKVLFPGLIDPHVHPMLPAILTQMPFLAPDDWSLPTGFFPGAITPESYWETLAKYYEQHEGDEPFFTWGYHPMFHGPLTRADLDSKISADKPVGIWDRSFHGIYLNSAALEWFGLKSEDNLATTPGTRECTNLEAGHFWEAGLVSLMEGLQKLFIGPERIIGGMATFGAMVRKGGITSIADMGLGLMIPPEQELALQTAVFSDPSCGFRVLAVPIETAFVTDGSTEEQIFNRIEAMQAESVDKNVQVTKHLKLMADGAFYSQGFRLCSPGYIDGHEGDWILPPEISTKIAKAAWDRGYQLHVHCNGDEGADFSLGLINDLLNEKPRFDHRFTLEHWGYSTDEQNRRAAVLGVQVSGQPYYTKILGDKYAQHGLGYSRAKVMARFNTVLAHGMNLALHSDCPMAPLEPLELARTAVNRQTLEDNVVGQNERITVEQALRAITIDAAWNLGLEESIGSIRAGKSADFVVLDSDPVADLESVKILGTIYQGVPVVEATIRNLKEASK